MHRQTRPYRADMVGTLLRGARLKQARTKFAAGDLSAEALRGVEDEEIVALIACQEEIGLEAVTDGEFRRSWWHYDFFNHLQGRASGATTPSASRGSMPR
jgi:5-methyltetrahydropteroyltriglutamate--homocysteine methyltransferase